MKKVLPIVLIITLLMGINSCKKQEGIKAYETTDLVGTWELASAKLYDREAKFLTETTPRDAFECGFLTWIFTTDQIEILTYVGKDENDNCLEERTILRYTLENNTIKTIDDSGFEEEMLISHLTADDFIFMTSLPHPDKKDENAIQYTEIQCKRVK